MSPRPRKSEASPPSLCCRTGRYDARWAELGQRRWPHELDFRAFATMQEAEGFIKRNTPLLRAVLSATYDRPPSEPRRSPTQAESIMNDEDILSRLKVIDRRLRQISTEEAASVLAGGLASAGIGEEERLRLIAETERILDELDGKEHD